MELTKDFLKQKSKAYADKAEQFKQDHIFNLGASQAINGLIADMAMEEFTEEDVESVEVVEEEQVDTKDTPK